MNSSISPIALESQTLWQSRADAGDRAPMGLVRMRPRAVRPWQQRGATAAVVVLMQIAFAVVLVRAGYMTLPHMSSPLEVVNIPASTTTPRDLEPPLPVKVAPMVPMEVPVVIDVASETAITLPPPAPQKTTAPASGTSNSGAIIADYQTTLLRHLNAHKRYPPAARARRQQGVATIRFIMDRGGNVLSADLAASSRIAALDDESLELLHRASPLPAPPAEVRGDPIVMIVPVEFYLR